MAQTNTVARNLALKLAVNGAAVATTAGTWLLGRRLDKAAEVPALAGATLATRMRRGRAPARPARRRA